MEENSEILNRLERLESKEDIRDLVSKYAEACDQQDLESLEKLFTEDAEFDSPSGMLKSKGRQNIIDSTWRCLNLEVLLFIGLMM